MKPTPLVMLVALLGGCGSAAEGDHGVHNSGHHRALTLTAAGVAAEGQAFVTEILERQDCGEGCTDERPLASARVTCVDESVCSVDGDPVRAGPRLRFTVVANRPGFTTLHVVALRADGSRVEDTFCLRVARPTSLEVSCPACTTGVPVGEAAGATCRLYNRSVSPEPLLGLCEAHATTPDVDVTRLAPGDLPGAMAPSLPGAVLGSAFSLTRRADTAGQVWFHHAGLRVAVTAQ